jgi:hypothetical protein
VRMLLRVKGLHQWIDPVLAAEIVAARTLQREGINVNQDLPDLERLFSTGPQRVCIWIKWI